MFNDGSRYVCIVFFVTMYKFVIKVFEARVLHNYFLRFSIWIARRLEVELLSQNHIFALLIHSFFTISQHTCPHTHADTCMHTLAHAHTCIHAHTQRCLNHFIPIIPSHPLFLPKPFSRHLPIFMPCVYWACPTEFNNVCLRKPGLGFIYWTMVYFFSGYSPDKKTPSSLSQR